MTAVQSQVDGGGAAQDVADAHRQLLTDRSIQFELPTGGQYSPSQAGPMNPGQSGQQGQPNYGPSSDPSANPYGQQGPSAGPNGHTVPADPSAGGPPGPVGPDAPSFGGGSGVNGLMEVFLWVAAGIALAILLYWLFTFFRDRKLGSSEPRVKRQRGAARSEEAWRPAEAPAQQLLDEADVLANEGRYDEAARLLLHRSIGEIDAHRPDLVRPALTSRDIAGHPLLPAGPATAFARIAALVERSLFARRPLGLDDWQDCRAAYREFAFAKGWRG